MTQKKILIFLHGWGGSKESFTPLIKSLEQNPQGQLWEYKALDLPGFGMEKCPPIEGWNTQDYAHWLDHQWKDFGLDKASEVALYGHSFGCRVIIRWLLLHPEFQGKIILTGAAGIKWPLSLNKKIIQSFSKIIQPLLKPFPRLRNILLRLLGAHDWAGINPGLKATFQKTIAEEDLRIYLPEIKQKCLLLWGKKDTYTPIKSAQVFHEQLKYSELVVFPEGRHGIHHTHSKEIASLVLNFLNS